MVLELARKGAELVAITSFHGELEPLDQRKEVFKVQSVSVHHAQYDFQGDQVLLDIEAELTEKVGIAI